LIDKRLTPFLRGFYQLSTINYQLSEMASVIGLAPIRPGLKDRLRELLCIHGLRA